MVIIPPAPQVPAPAGCPPPAVSLRPLLRRRLMSSYRYVEENLVFIGVLLYAYVTFVGLLYSEALYWKIGINPLSFFEPTDFLLAGLRHPVALTIPVIILILDLLSTLILFLPALWVVKKKALPAQLARQLERVNRFFLYFNLGSSVLVALLALFLTPAIAIQTIDQCGQPVRIYLRKEAAGERETANPLSRTIIGSTQTMLLLQDADKHAYGVMPVDVMREIIPNGRSAQDSTLRVVCAVFQ